MVFSSLVFLWLFLPLVLVGYFVVPSRVKNLFLLAASLFFYAWGEPVYILLMLSSVFINWSLGLLMEKYSSRKGFFLTAAVLINLALLIFFKYLGFITGLMNQYLHTTIPAIDIKLPIGISFFTFQILSYVIDLYRGKYRAQKNIIHLSLYISFFPQLIAGPIVRYIDINEQLSGRVCSLEKTMDGIRRFLYGLGKKVLIANVMAECVDSIYALNSNDITGWMAWTAGIMYMLQIYYDFSGYSDMAIGMGKMFGFEFQENFHYPYLSRSIQEFWRRWHISLGTWFREYLYIPLGGNRKGTARTYLNLLIVFFITGLWHGANLTFVVWGLYHGLAQIIEKLGWKKILDKSRMLSHLYSFIVVLFGWVIFRAETLPQAADMAKRMLFFWQYTQTTVIWQEFLHNRMIFTALLGLAGCGIFQKLAQKFRFSSRWKYSYAELIYCGCIAVFSLAALAANTYNPFIYFRF